MIAAIIALGVVAAAQLALFLWVLQAGAVERDRLLDRIQAPDAPRLAAIAETFEPDGRDFPKPDDIAAPVEITWDDDLQLINAEEYTN